MDHTIEANFEVQADGGLQDHEGRIIRAMRQAIQDLPMCGDQAHNEAARIFYAISALQRELASMASEQQVALMQQQKEQRIARMQPSVSSQRVEVAPSEPETPANDGVALTAIQHPVDETVQVPEDVSQHAVETIEASEPEVQ